MSARVLVVVDQQQGVLRRSVAELAGLVSQLGYAGDAVSALVAGGGAAPQAAQAACSYYPRVYLCAEENLSHERRTSLVTALARELGVELMLFGTGRSAAAVAPRVAWRLAGVFLEEVHALTRSPAGWLAERLAYLARANLSVRSAQAPAIVTVKGGMFTPAEATERGLVTAWTVAPEAADGVVTVGVQHGAKRGRVALEEAQVVVCGGRGLGNADAYAEHVVGLATDLGAGLAATRAAVDAGWRPYDEQVGQTGKSVNPKLYIGLGVSGAVQHLSGMNRSGVIVAVNKDPEAPIFKMADYALVGDVAAVVPALRAALATLVD